MAKVKHFSKAQIKRLSGVIDFYYWKDIAVARKWPDWSHFKPSPGQKASMAAYSSAMTNLKLVTPHLRDLWRSLCVGKATAWVDDYSKKYMGYWKIYKTYPAVMCDYEDMGDV